MESRLITKELLKDFKKIGNQEEAEDPIVVAKFFNISGAGTWFATEYDETLKVFFGYVSIFGDHCDEWGSFSLELLESVSSIIEDKSFKKMPMSEALKKFYINRELKKLNTLYVNEYNKKI